MSEQPWDGICPCGHKHSEHKTIGFNPNITAGKCSIENCTCPYFSHRPPGYTQEFSLPHTINEKFPNDSKLKGALCVFCIGDKVEITARGLTPRQIVKILGIFISKLF